MLRILWTKHVNKKVLREMRTKMTLIVRTREAVEISGMRAFVYKNHFGWLSAYIKKLCRSENS